MCLFKRILLWFARALTPPLPIVISAQAGPMESALNAAANAATKGELQFKMAMCGNLPDKDKNCA